MHLYVCLHVVVYTLICAYPHIYLCLPTRQPTRGTNDRALMIGLFGKTITSKDKAMTLIQGVCVCIYVYTHMHLFANTPICAHMHTCVLCSCVCLYTCVCTPDLLQGGDDA